MAFEPEATRGQSGMSGESGTRREFGGEGRMHDVREKTRDVLHDARERTGDVMSRAGDRARSRIDDGRSRAARSLSAVASALRESGENLRRNNEATVAPVMDRVADGVDRLSEFLSSRDTDDMMRDVQSFARRRPEVFLGAFFTLGVVAARFLKSGHRESGMDRHGYTYVHGTEGARMPDVRETERGTSRFGYEASRGYSEGGAFSETTGPSVPYTRQSSRGYSATGVSGGETGQRELPRGTESEGGTSERESNRFER